MWTSPPQSDVCNRQTSRDWNVGSHLHSPHLHAWNLVKAIIIRSDGTFHEACQLLTRMFSVGTHIPRERTLAIIRASFRLDYTSRSTEYMNY